MTSPVVLDLTPDQPQLLPRFRETVDEIFPPLRVTPLDRAGLRARLTSAGSPALQVTHLTANSHLVERRPGAHASSDQSYYKISLQLTGSLTMAQGNRESTLSPGTLALYDTARAYDLCSEADFSFLVAMFPKAALALPHGVAGDLAAVPIPTADGVGAILASYLCTLNENLPVLGSGVGERLGRTFTDLLSTLIAETLEVHTDEATARHTTLIRVLAYIDEHLSDPDLDPAAIAAAHYLSVRHLYNLFTPTGTTVAQWIKQRRLDGARRELADPLRAPDTVAVISERWGFDDAGYFSRVFKQQFGQTPGAWRRASLAAPARATSS